MLKKDDHAEVSRRVLGRQGIVVGPGKFVIDFVSFGGFKSTNNTNPSLLASSYSSASVASPSVANPSVKSSFLAR